MEENCVGRKRWKMLVVCWARWDCKIIDICLHEVYGSHLSNVELIRHMRCAFCVLTEYLLFYELFTHRIQYARSTKKWGRQKDRILSHCTRVMNENIPFFFVLFWNFEFCGAWKRGQKQTQNQWNILIKAINIARSTAIDHQSLRAFGNPTSPIAATRT